MKTRYIYWFSLFNATSPSVRYRGKYVLEKLESSYGISYSITYPGYDPISIFKFIRMYFSALFFRKKDSLIVIQRVYTKRIYSTALRFLVLIRTKNTLYDIDDAEYVSHPPETIHFFMKHCSACSVGSRELLNYAKKINTRSFLLTSPITEHAKRKTEDRTIFTIGWIGCFWGAHKESLYQLFFPALQMIDSPLKVVILGAKTEDQKEELIHHLSQNKNIELEIPLDIDWFDDSAIYERVRNFDLGVSPLLDTEINRAKSAYKLKQYFSCGVPALCSNIGENAFFLKDGMNGYFCDTPEEYRNKILSFMTMDSKMYQTLSLNALSGLPGFNLEHYCNTLLGYFDELK